MIQKLEVKRKRSPLTPEQQQIVADNMRLAFKFSRIIPKPGDMSRDEWQAECLYALVLAAEAWQPSRGALSTMVHWLVRYVRWNHIRRSHTQCRGFGRTQSLGGLEEVIGEEVEQDHGLIWVEVKDQADQLITSLPPTHRHVIRERMEGKSLQEIGQEIGRSRERVRQIEFEALRRMYRFARFNKVQKAI